MKNYFKISFVCSIFIFLFLSCSSSATYNRELHGLKSEYEFESYVKKFYAPYAQLSTISLESSTIKQMGGIAASKEFENDIGSCTIRFSFTDPDTNEVKEVIAYEKICRDSTLFGTQYRRESNCNFWDLYYCGKYTEYVEKQFEDFFIKNDGEKYPLKTLFRKAGSYPLLEDNAVVFSNFEDYVANKSDTTDFRIVINHERDIDVNKCINASEYALKINRIKLYDWIPFSCISDKTTFNNINSEEDYLQYKGL